MLYPLSYWGRGCVAHLGKTSSPAWGGGKRVDVGRAGCGGLFAGQLRVLGADLASSGIGGVGAVGVEDGGHDSVAVVDGLDPRVDIFGALRFGVDKRVRSLSAVQCGNQALAERAPVGKEDGDVLSGFGSGNVGAHYAAAFLS